MRPSSRKPGFSLIELVIVIIIMGVISAIAIPRMVRGAEGAEEVALQQDLTALRNALELYRVEHAGNAPNSALGLMSQLTMYTDAAGNVSTTPSPTHLYGPYLHKIPPLPLGANAGSNRVRNTGSPGDGDEGWFYDPVKITIVSNTGDGDVDADGIPFSDL